MAGNESYTGLLNSNLLPCSWDIAYRNEIISSWEGSCICFVKRNRLDIISTYRSWTTGSNNFYPAFERGRRKKKKNQSLDVHRHVHLVADTMQLCSLCQTRVSERWITMQRISDITQTGSRAREKEDHLSSTVFQPQDETSVSGVRRKNPFSLNCLVNPEVVRAGAELCKRRRDEANSTTSLWWGQSGFTDVSERSGYPGGMEWRGGFLVVEAEQEMIRNIWGGKPFEMLRCCWDEADLGLDKSVQAVTEA